MHHVLGTVAGIVAIPIWTVITVAVAVNATYPVRVFPGEPIMVLAILGAMFVLGWFVDRTVTLAVREREDIYMRGVCDAIHVDEGLNVKTIGRRNTK